MARILILYSTVDDHTRLIASRLSTQLQKAGHSVCLASLTEHPLPDVGSSEKIVIGASIRYGKHRPEVYQFIKRNHELLQKRPSAFFSVNLVARKPGKDSPDNNPYVTRFMHQIGWRPTLTAVFAGKLEYQKYGFFDRHIIRLIMWLTGGPTELNASVEFTDWTAVEAFGTRISSM